MVEVKIFNDGELVTESKGKVVFFALARPVGHEEADGFSGIIGMTNREETAGNMENAIMDAARLVSEINTRVPEAFAEKYIKF